MLREYIYLFSHKLIGSKVTEYYKEFLQLEKVGLAQLQTIKAERLANILKHASSQIPFYRAISFPKDGLSLTDFPILTKYDLRTRYQDLMTEKLRLQYQRMADKGPGYSWILVKSGGSTGIPSIVIHDKEFRDRGRAGRLYSQYLCGFPIATPYFRLWGSMEEINQMKGSVSQALSGFLTGQTLLNAFKMRDQDIKRYIKIINSSSVKHMMAYADAAYQMAKYILRTREKVKPLKSIMACAATVTDDIRQTLKAVFQARVHNKYGSRECADMACECEAGGLHIYNNNVVLEVVGPDGSPLEAGQTGRILVTLLFNYSFPLIRYEIGDLGSLSARQCPCGRPFPLLESLEGRSIEFLKDNNGGYVTPVYIIHLIGVVHNPGYIRRFQLVQTSLLDFELQMEVEPDTPEPGLNDTIDKIERDLKAVLGEQSRIITRRVAEIPAAPSGKFFYTINNLEKTIN
jgi:phenylacetate-CoA ligase